MMAQDDYIPQKDTRLSNYVTWLVCFKHWTLIALQITHDENILIITQACNIY